MNRFFAFGVILFVVGALFFGGCASIVSKSTYPVSITSEPNNSDISIADEMGKVVFQGKTPTTVSLSTKAGYFKGKDYTVTFEQEGYAKHTANIKRGVDGWYIAGNIFIGGLVGWLIVDPLTGAMWTLEKECHATLTPLSSSDAADGSLKIVAIDEVPESLISKLKKIN